MEQFPPGPPRRRPDVARVNQWLLWLGLAAAVAWLLWRHGAHLGEVWPFLLLLACPLMHLFGHRRGSHHGSHSHRGTAHDEDGHRRTSG